MSREGWIPELVAAVEAETAVLLLAGFEGKVCSKCRQCGWLCQGVALFFSSLKSLTTIGGGTFFIESGMARGSEYDDLPWPVTGPCWSRPCRGEQHVVEMTDDGAFVFQAHPELYSDIDRERAFQVLSGEKPSDGEGCLRLAMLVRRGELSTSVPAGDDARKILSALRGIRLGRKMRAGEPVPPRGSGWKKLVVDAVTYFYRVGRQNVVIAWPDGKKSVVYQAVVRGWHDFHDSEPLKPSQMRAYLLKARTTR